MKITKVIMVILLICAAVLIYAYVGRDQSSAVNYDFTGERGSFDGKKYGAFKKRNADGSYLFQYDDGKQIKVTPRRERDGAVYLIPSESERGSQKGEK